MYAVIQTGGKQYRVAEGDVVDIELLPEEAGAAIDFERVLLIVDGKQVKVGRPFVEGARVSARILDHGRGDKVMIIKFRRRKHHMKRQGHRQWFSRVEITGIGTGA
ncbi:MAG: 50S ribosomal protein L21 [Gammaproteobacteria bacterium]|nr:50S ribosomal protein L21 [Gammaproteobacteria bacterium]